MKKKKNEKNFDIYSFYLIKNARNFFFTTYDRQKCLSKLIDIKEITDNINQHQPGVLDGTQQTQKYVITDLIIEVDTFKNEEPK